jgi:hypothetical protein
MYEGKVLGDESLISSKVTEKVQDRRIWAEWGLWQVTDGATQQCWVKVVCRRDV